MVVLELCRYILSSVRLGLWFFCGFFFFYFFIFYKQKVIYDRGESKTSICYSYTTYDTSIKSL